MVNLEYLRVGDTMIFADGTQGICTVSYNNGGSRFIRWAVPGKDWSESDAHCCQAMMPVNGRRGYVKLDESYSEHPKDIVDIVKPPLHELQDENERLRLTLAQVTATQRERA
jgi:hypothetical protein